MKLSAKIAVSILATSLFLFSSPLRAEGESEKAETVVSRAEKQVTAMNGVLKKFLREVQKAREENDVRRVNCLLAKVILVKGFIKASERAKDQLMEASFGEDRATEKTYSEKISSYDEAVMGLDQSIDECARFKPGEGPVMAYIRPEDGAELSEIDTTPWNWDSYSGSEGYPAVPPASPYR